jgi:non-specific serine/threonine protein kinase
MSGDSILPNGQEVKLLRRSRGWTQEDLARRIQERAGSFSKRTLQNIEAGKPVHLRSIRLVAEVLGADVTRLLHGRFAAPNNLPSPLTSFVGREKELIEVRDLLDLHRLLTLVGAGGCGKSRLALELAGGLISEYSDGVWQVELAPIAVPSLVPQAVADTLGLREEKESELTDVLIGHLRRSRSLLILDNCEHLLPACAEIVRAVLSACPHVRFLATSREPLNLTGETTYVVPPLQLPDPDHESSVDELRSVESVQLFAERASAVGSDFSLSESNVAAVIEICRRLDGIPLALELAAARVRTISLSEIAGRLADRFHLLTGGHRSTLSQHRTLRALIDWSYDFLASDEQVLLRRLSVFSGGWTLRAAEDICVGETIEKRDVLDLLSHLADKSLVELSSDAVDGTGTGRYRLLETVRQYASERLTDEEEACVARRRHRDFYLALAKEAAPELDGPDQRKWLSRLKDEHDNLRAAVRWCLEGDDAEAEIGLSLVGVLGQFWDICGYWREGRANCAELLSRTAAGGGTAVRAEALRTAGKLALLLGDVAEARARYEESLAISRKLAHENGVASALYELGGLALHHGDFAAARELYTDSLASSRDLGDQRGVAQSLMNLGAATWRQGDIAAAHSLLEESLVIMRGIEDQRGIARVIASLGNVAYAQRKHAEARTLYAESLVMFRELGDKLGTANVLNNLGNVARRQHDLAAARSYYEDGLAITEELADKRGRGGALQNLGNVAFMQGDYAQARRLYEESLAIDRDLGHKQGVAQVLGNLADVATCQGLHSEARALFEESLEICRELGDRQGIANSLGGLALVALCEGDVAVTRSLCEQSLALCRELDDIAGVAERLLGLGCVEHNEGRADRAVRLLASGHSIAKRIDHRIHPSIRERSESSVSELRGLVDGERFDSEWAGGQEMGPEQAVEFALG